MALLFSYGDLQREEVQLSTLGRLLEGQSDELLGFEPAAVGIDDPHVRAATGKTHHANVELSADGGSRVRGMVFEVSEAELARTDAFESPFSYRRVAASLASGREAWVYLHAPGTGRTDEAEDRT